MWAKPIIEYWIGFRVILHGETYSPPPNIHIVEYIKVSKDLSRSISL